MRHQEGPTGASAISNSTGRAPVTARQSSTSRILLRDVDVDRGVLRQGARDLPHHLHRHGPQRVRGDADLQRLPIAPVPAQRLQYGQQTLLVSRKATLRRLKRSAVEACPHIEHRHHRQRDPGLRCGMDEPGGHLGRVGIGRAIPVVVQVVKLADRGVARFQHLDEKMLRDGAQLVGPDGMGNPVHRLPPGPETIGRVAPLLGEPSHRALEGVGMEVRHARNHRAAEALDPVAAARRHVGRDGDDGAVGRDIDPHIPRPAGGQHGAGCEQARHGWSSLVGRRDSLYDSCGTVHISDKAMATGWAPDGAVQDQIDDTVTDAVARARANMPQGQSEPVCVECGEDIPEARQRALPGVRFCIDCQSARDRRPVTIGFNRRGSKDSQLK